MRPERNPKRNVLDAFTCGAAVVVVTFAIVVFVFVVVAIVVVAEVLVLVVVWVTLVELDVDVDVLVAVADVVLVIVDVAVPVVVVSCVEMLVTLTPAPPLQYASSTHAALDTRARDVKTADAGVGGTMTNVSIPATASSMVSVDDWLDEPFSGRSEMNRGRVAALAEDHDDSLRRKVMFRISDEALPPTKPYCSSMSL